MKQLMRYLRSSIYFIAGISISLFALFDVLNIYNGYLSRIEAQKKSNYTSEAELFITVSDTAITKELDQLDEIIDGDVNVKTEQLLLKSSDSIYSWYTDILLISRIPEHIWMTDAGRLEFSEETDQRVIAAGRNRVSFARTSGDEKYLYLENQEAFLVVGTIGMDNSDYQDGYLVTRYKDLPDEWKERLIQNGKLTLILQSDEYMSDEWINNVVLNIYKNWNCVTDISAQRTFNSQTGMVYIDSNGLSIPLCIYIFSGLILIEISMFWIRERRNEMVMRKIFG